MTQNGEPNPLQKPKTKTYRACFLSDFININIQLKQKTYPMPKINEMLLK